MIIINYKESIVILRENIEIRELVNKGLYHNAFDKLTSQYDRIYSKIEISEILENV